MNPFAPLVRHRNFRIFWLGQTLAGRATLDAFGGSGALSFEALSRGARLAVLVEKDPSCARAIASAASTLGADGRFHADEVLAKHDEKYTPPPLERALREARASADGNAEARR